MTTETTAAPTPVPAHVRDDAAAELGSTVAGDLPIAPVEPPRARIDVGAARLVNELLARMDDRRQGADGVTTVGLSQLRNQSHCTSREFNRLVDRLEVLLTDAGRTDSIRFTGDPEATTDYELLGTAYLITADGFDQWELYLRAITSADAWTIWRPRNPLRMLRSPRPAGQQVYFLD